MTVIILRKKILQTASYLFLGLIFSTQVFPSDSKPTAYTVTLPIYDHPYNQSLDLRNPSMNQSLYFSKGFYQFAHYNIQKFWDHSPTASTVSVIIFDAISSWIPLSSAWVHEEWHRAVMGQYGIDSYDEIFEMEFFSETIAVSDVGDGELIDLKKNHPADLIRLHSAGLESQNQFNLLIEKDQFFHNSLSMDNVLLLFNTINTSSYLSVCASDEANKLTKEILDRENEDISKRDFTGLDCNAWVYDLFKPDEPYENRGTHPSGVGIDRYITWSDLTSAEKDFLRKQFYLSFLNFADPFLLNKRYFRWIYEENNPAIYWNANLKHYLTPFGYTVNAHLFLKNDQRKFLLTLYNHFNRKYYFPGIGAEVFDILFSVRNFILHNSLSLTIWSQPEDFGFNTKENEIGARATIKSNYQWTKMLGSYLELEYKTKGWYEGNVYLSENFSARAGISLKFH